MSLSQSLRSLADDVVTASITQVNSHLPWQGGYLGLKISQGELVTKCEGMKDSLQSLITEVI